EEPVVEEPVVEEPVVEEPVVEEPSISNYIYVGIQGLNYREGPSSDFAVIRVLDYQEQLEIIDSENADWIHVVDSSGVSGYVFHKYVNGINEEIESKIVKMYPDVDYQYYDKPMDYENNPYTEVKGIYVSGNSAATNIDKFIDIVKNTEINALIIDIKDDNGKILFPSVAAQNTLGELYEYHIKDMDAFMKKLKDEDIYVIGRLVSFKSPKYALTHPERAIINKDGSLFKTNDGIIWGTPYDRDLWTYLISIAKEAADFGFNEIQFDYVRFPTASSSNLDSLVDYRNELGETKTKAIQSFIKYAQDSLNGYDVYLSADVYGWTSTAINDVGIGQHWEGISNVIDIISPMFYPSHYGSGNYGFDVPDAHPYEVMNRATEDAISRNENIETPAKIRPWIQSFTATWVKGHIIYTINEVNDQIRALKELGINEYILWNSSNSYKIDGIGVE
ncbi:MAG: SH3 domain-containing protein, partial [Clostridiales bacterium]|nr:SH3 domain-containing protein [Clostridiales bacterium]